MKKFDEGKLMFHVGRGEVIAGLDEAVAGMRAGGVRKLRIPPHLGYGTSGAPPKVPPHATLLFDVAVVRIGSRKQVCVCCVCVCVCTRVCVCALQPLRVLSRVQPQLPVLRVTAHSESNEGDILRVRCTLIA
jgi:hypothetical protein